jgi:dihydroxy-acid dehydratase
VHDGDIITIDAEKREIRLDLSDEELELRMAQWQRPPARYTSGVLAKYAATVSSASEGAVTRA